MTHPAHHLTELIAYLTCTHRTTIDSKNTLINLAARHHVLPLLAKKTRRPDISKATQLQNLQQLALLKSVVTELEKSSLPFFVLKGLPLAQQLYGDIGLRPSSDLDLLIKPDDFEPVNRLLIHIGFKAIRPIGKKCSRGFFLWQKDMTYAHPNHPVKIDLHWRFDRNPSWNPIAFNLLWQHHETVNISGITLPVLGKNDNLLYLCQHGAKHGWSTLKWLQDIVNFCEAYTIDWPVLWQQAKRRHVTRPLLQAFMLIERLYGKKPLLFTPTISKREKRCLTKVTNHAMHYLTTTQEFTGTHLHRIRYHWQLCRYWRYKVDSYRVICWRHATWWQQHRLPTWAFGCMYIAESLILLYELIRK